MNNLQDHISNHAFFANIDVAYQELIAGCAREKHFTAGEFLMKEGDTANRFYLLTEGQVAIECFLPGRGPMTVRNSHGGDMVGFSWLFPPFRVAFDARAMTPVETIMLDGRCLRGKTETDHELGYLLMKQFAQMMLKHMQSARRQMLDIYATPLPQVG